MEKTLEEPINQKSELDEQNPVVQRALKIKTEWTPVMSEKYDEEWVPIQDLWESIWDTRDDPNTPMNPMLFWQVTSKCVSKMRPMEYLLRIEGTDEEEKQVVKDAVSQIMDNSGFISILRDNFGAFWRQVLFGHAFIQFGATDQENTPIKFQTVSLTNVYFPKETICLRTKNGENSAQECFVIEDSTWGQVVAEYPEAAKLATHGPLPNSDSRRRLEEGETIEGRIQESETHTQVGKYYNIKKGIYYIMVGKNASIIRKYQDNKRGLRPYPFKLEGKNYIPLVDFRTFPRSRGFYAAGLGHLYYKPSKYDTEFSNMAYNHVKDNVYPTRMIRSKSNEFESFMAQIMESREQQAMGERSFVWNSSTDPVQVETLTVPPLTGEFERIKNDTAIQIKRSGTPLDDIDRPAGQTATQTITEESNANQFVLEIQEQNATSYEFVVKVMIDFMKRFIRKSNKTIVVTNATLKLNDGSEADIEGITMGMVSDSLKKNEVVVQVKARTGAYNNIGLELAYLNAGMQYAAGTPYQAQLSQKALGTLGFSTKSQQLTPQPEQQSQPDLNAIDKQTQQFGTGQNTGGNFALAQGMARGA